MDAHNTGSQASLSIVVPLFNEEAVLPLFHRELTRTLIETLAATQVDSTRDWELIYVNDGSTDDTQKLVQGYAGTDRRVRVLRLSRNFGHQAALLAGIQAARGDAIVTLDGDLQHPPGLIPALIAEWRQGYHIVATRRRDAGGLSLFKRLSSRFFYRFFRRISGLALYAGMADFRLLDRCVVEALSQLDERALFLRGVLQWSGFRQTVIEYQAQARAAGKTKYSLRKMLRLALDGITSFSTTPLRLAMVLGFCFSILSFIYLCYALIVWWLGGYTISGWTSVIGSVLFLGGIQLICLGIIGEYIAKIFVTVRKRPVYLIEERTGFES